MPEDKLWFRHTIEGLMRGVGTRATPELKAKIATHGVNLERLLPAYPNEVMAKVVREVGATLFPTLEVAAADREMGRLFLEGYGSTFVGAAMLQLMRIIGPRLTLERMQRNFRTGTNFIETRFRSLGRYSAEVWFNDDAGIPQFYAGIILEGSRHTGASNATVECVAHEDHSCTIRVDWEE